MLSKLRKLAIEASVHSHSPYSKAKVGSAILTTSGSFFSGCNIENSSFGGTVCAERVAVWKAISEGQQSLKHIYVFTQDGWPPCGMCLQVISEFSSKETQITIGSAEKENILTQSIHDFLPNAFTPSHLIDSDSDQN